VIHPTWVTATIAVQETLTNLPSEVDSAISEAEDVSDSVQSTLGVAFDTYKAALEATPSAGPSDRPRDPEGL
jgi:hypothetical protein